MVVKEGRLPDPSDSSSDVRSPVLLSPVLHDDMLAAGSRYLRQSDD